MLHYNFPPFSVGETGRMTGTGRREIGHGALAERAISAVLPTAEESPYSIRIVSDILESNGSSSMASVCGASLALYDAGIALKGSVAGVAMGLVKEGDDYAILTDIAGAEDHYGEYGLQSRRHAEGNYRPSDGHQDWWLDSRDPATGNGAGEARSALPAGTRWMRFWTGLARSVRRMHRASRP